MRMLCWKVTTASAFRAGRNMAWERRLDVKLFGAEDERLAVATNTEHIKVFDTRTWHCQILHGHTEIVMAVDVHKAGQYMVSGSKDCSIRVWRVAGEGVECVAVGRGHSKAINAVAFSRVRPDFVVSAGEDQTLKLWSMAEAVKAKDAQSIASHLTERAHDKDINSVAVAPNDKLIVTGSQDKTAKLWRADDLSLVGTFRGHKRGLWCVTFSPVDQAIATASADGTIKIWSIADFTCVKTFEGHESSVLKVVFVARGMQLVSCGSDGLVKLWTIKTNECARTFDEHTDKIWALCSSQAEDRIVTGGADSTLIVWKDVTEQELQLARAEQEEFIQKEQKLMNLLQQKKYLKAIGLAITLEQPFRLLKIIRAVLAEEDGLAELESTLVKLREDQIGSVLRFAVEWNTNSKHCYEAQTILNIVLKSYTPQRILDLPNIRATLEGFLPYTERHFQRQTRLQQQATFLDFTLQCMKLVDPASDLVSDGFVAPAPDVEFVIDRTGSLGALTAAAAAGGGGDSASLPDSDDDEMSAEEEEMSAEERPRVTPAKTKSKPPLPSKRKRLKVG